MEAVYDDSIVWNERYYFAVFIESLLSLALRTMLQLRLSLQVALFLQAMRSFPFPLRGPKYYRLWFFEQNHDIKHLLHLVYCNIRPNEVTRYLKNRIRESQGSMSNADHRDRSKGGQAHLTLHTQSQPWSNACSLRLQGKESTSRTVLWSLHLP